MVCLLVIKSATDFLLLLLESRDKVVTWYAPQIMKIHVYFNVYAYSTVVAGFKLYFFCIEST